MRRKMEYLNRNQRELLGMKDANIWDKILLGEINSRLNNAEDQ